ncbi:uncharacterized protein LOC127879083 [Dreissena polymorpha]|uniref:Uncharacterized protein n=1 Tax=Dreissena polymorpha TaxID=45954 RepID=A0A9D4KEN9_DREPO|nr:uncharacterized protein LOC127879083 [Dreissena polymorpha]KAH3837821.1 hypothetical protein DPMN_111222 [Dreissena polymorpha]
MTDKDLFDSDYDGSSQIHEHSYIVISDSEETQPPSPFGLQEYSSERPVVQQPFFTNKFLVLPFLINRHIIILDKNSDYWLHIQPNFWVLRWWGVTCFRPESCRTIQLQGHLT